MKPAVILVSPIGNLNVGSIARVMGNFGLSELRIVAPRCNLKSVECKQMAMQSYDLVLNAKIFDTFEQAIADLQQVIALSGRAPTADCPQDHLYSFIPQMPSRLKSHETWGLVFGREEWGLRSDELALCHWQLSIPTTENYPSINLAAAAAIVFSTLFSLGAESEKSNVVRLERERPKKHEEEIFFDKLFRLLDEVKFTNPQNPALLNEDIRALYHRADIRDRDLRILFGILMSVEMTLRGVNNVNTPKILTKSS